MEEPRVTIIKDLIYLTGQAANYYYNFACPSQGFVIINFRKNFQYVSFYLKLEYNFAILTCLIHNGQFLPDNNYSIICFSHI